jgi:hypothetical protein
VAEDERYDLKGDTFGPEAHGERYLQSIAEIPGQVMRGW